MIKNSTEKVIPESIVEKMELGFANVNKRIDTGFVDINKRMSKGFADVDKRFEQVENRITSEIEDFARITAKEFEKVHVELNGLDRRVEGVENKIQHLDRRLDNILFDKIKPLEIRVTKAEKKLSFAK